MNAIMQLIIVFTATLVIGGAWYVLISLLPEKYMMILWGEYYEERKTKRVLQQKGKH